MGLYKRFKFRLVNYGLLSIIFKSFEKSKDFFFPPRINEYTHCIKHFNGKYGLEIGGPSFIFTKEGGFPVYHLVKKLDNIDFSNETIWHKKKSNSFTYKGKVIGENYISEASDLSNFQDSSFDFVLSSEMLQHLANPLRALKQISIVLKNKGVLFLVTPNPLKTFDHLRPITEFEHLMLDYKNETSEDDMTHLEEVLKLHDLSRDDAAGNFIEFKKRCEDNKNIRGMHHHLFDLDLIKKCLTYFGFELIYHTYFKNNIITISVLSKEASVD